ncbi:MAG: disulfide bond formation protein DsbD [Bacteroidetes bacterium]|jgi:hypothetical protein|nr:disulfide bond formation protein DsbD [Bacteroidota bacterium]
MKHFFISFLLFVLGVFAPVFSFAQVPANPVKWEYSYERISETEGYIVIKAGIDDKWHIYSQNQSSDGPIATSFMFTGTGDYEPVGKTQEPTAEKVYSEVFGTDVISFSKLAVFRQRIKRKNQAAFVVSAELEFMACNDNTCLPPKTIKFTVNVPAK